MTKEVIEGYIYVFIDWEDSDIIISDEKQECRKKCDFIGCHCEGLPSKGVSFFDIFSKYTGKKVRVTVEVMEDEG